ncbi:unnamed protein product [Mytilus edulis]|uniref:Uncharacterized protein n=1 Tax=Mytilus edulis TaxID=6550 RepID=A0A8S3UMW8_MYTED|nr:unnamed protein product [Mytilus edulis]
MLTCVDYSNNHKMKFMITYLSSYLNTEIYVDKFEKDQHLRLDTLCREDKIGILKSHMIKNNLNVCNYSYESNHDDPDVIDDVEKSVQIYKRTFDNIIITYTLQGFPTLCQKFCSNRYLLYLENRYFDTPSKSVIEEINILREKAGIFERIKYAVLVYIMIHERACLKDNEINKDTFHVICQKIKIFHSDLQFLRIENAAEKLVGTFLKKIEMFMSLVVQHCQKLYGCLSLK